MTLLGVFPCLGLWFTHMSVLEQKVNQSLKLLPPFLVFPCSGFTFDKLVDPIHESNGVQKVKSLAGQTSLCILLSLLGGPLTYEIFWKLHRTIYESES